MSTAEEIQDDLSGLMDFLIELDLLLDSNLISYDGTTIGWRNSSATPLIRDFHRFTNLGDYREWLTGRNYTALMLDGAMLQITYGLEADDVIKHRMAYVPPPTPLDADLLRTDPVIDVLDATLTLVNDVTMASPVRFDFDRRAAGPTHPHSHLTINSSACRIPCLAPLKVGHFVQFVFEHFYPDLWAQHDYLKSFDRAGFGPPTVTDDQAGGLHVHWRSPAPISAR